MQPQIVHRKSYILNLIVPTFGPVMKHVFSILFLAVLCGVAMLHDGCTESKEAKAQRFLERGNHAMSEQKPEEAEHFFRESVGQDSCFAPGWNNLGIILFDQGKYQEALSCYEKALTCKPGMIETLLNRANVYKVTGQYKQALADLAQVKEAKPDTLVVYLALGHIYTQTGDYDQAEAAYEKAITLDAARHADILVNLGVVMYYQNQLDQAEALLKKAIAKDPEEPNSYNAMAMLCIRRAQYDEAMDWIEKALQQEPRNAFYLNNRGYIYLMKGDYELALNDINEGIMHDPYNAWGYRNKGIYYLKQNDPTAALRVLTQAEKIDPNLEKLAFYLGQTYALLGNNDKACIYYEQAMQKKEITEEQFPQSCR